MSSTTKIEWTDATWNPVTGCEKVSQGCKNCYAERLWPKVEGARVAREGGKPRPFTDVRFDPNRLDKPLHWREPRMVFVNSMSDLFHKDVPDAFIDQVFAVIALAPQHTFQVLTKRPERMRAYFKLVEGKQSPHGRIYDAAQEIQRSRPGGPRYNQWTNHTVCLQTPPPNTWLGVSVEDQATADERIPLLLQTPAAVRWISAEPLLAPISLRWLPAFDGSALNRRSGTTNELDGLRRLDWVVTGGESGPKARASHPDHFRSLRDQCQAAGVPFFFKQWGEWAPPVAEGDVPPGALDGRMYRVGKRFAGRLLDGIEHNEYPASPSTTTTKEPQ